MRLPRLKKYHRVLWILLFVLIIWAFIVSGRLNSSLLNQGKQYQETNTIRHVAFKTENKTIPESKWLNGFNSSYGHKLRADEEIQTVEDIKQEILRRNDQQFIQNLDKFPLRLTAESVVIVIQVHNREENFRILLESLQLVENIQNSLVIISHDVYSKELNQLVAEVDFCPVIQIFFPFSLQINPNKFPGPDPNGCPRDIKREEAEKINCSNYRTPDTYGHYREAKFTQIKHHWLWKLHHVFDVMNVMRNYKGLVLLLEEDYYVTPDIISTLQMTRDLGNKYCKNCCLLSARNVKFQNYQDNANQVDVENFFSSDMVMAFSADMWEEIKRCGKEFCYFDDYNWDWTLIHVDFKCFPKQVRALKLRANRVFHMGECGFHFKNQDCRPEKKRKMVKEMILNNIKHLFPKNMTMGRMLPPKLKDPKPNGGWADPRDLELCMSFIEPG